MAQGLQVKRVRVTSLASDFHQISWELAPTTEDVLDYVFEVLRSESAEGPYEVISPKLTDTFVFADNAVIIANILRVYYYKLRVTDCRTGASFETEAVSHQAEPDLQAMELRRQLDIIMREVSGRRGWLLPVRTMGQRCPACWNKTLNKQRFSGCITCYDQGFIRGFMRPIEVVFQLDPTSESEQPTQHGVIQQQDTTVRMPAYPPVKVGDILVEPENIRWRVRPRASTQQLRATVTQQLQVHRIPPTDILYSVPLNLGEGRKLEDMFFSPRRNFTNPQDIHNDGDALPEYFGLFNFGGNKC